MEGLREIDLKQFAVCGSSKLLDNTDEVEEMWNRQVLVYYRDNLPHIKARLRGFDHKLSDEKLDMVIAELGESLQTCRDYGDCDESEQKLSLENYVIKWGQYCIRRLRHREAEAKKIMAIPVKISDESDEEHDAFETLGDENASLRYRVSEVDLDSSLNQMLCKRNYYGIDVFNLLYIKIKGIVMNIGTEITNIISDVCGISSVEIMNAEYMLSRDEDFRSLNQDIAIILANNPNNYDVVNRLGEYVYGKSSIDKVISAVAGM